LISPLSSVVKWYFGANFLSSKDTMHKIFSGKPVRARARKPVAAFPAPEASADLMPSRITDDGVDARSGWNCFARGGGDPLGERRYNLFEFRLLDQRNRPARLNPLDQPLFELRPSLALSFNEQRKDFDLATHLDAVLVKQLVILEEPDRFRPNSPSDSGFFKGFARGRFCRPQALDRPTLRNDPAFGTPRGDKEDFKRGVWREPIGKRGVLDAKRRPDLPFAWLAGNLASPDSPASPATFWRLATQRTGGKLFAGALGRSVEPSIRRRAQEGVA
jgi:hypothetical protein